MAFTAAVRNKETGHVSYYTGKAGGDYLSPEKTDAFFDYGEEYAMVVAGRIAGFYDGLEALAVPKETTNGGW